MLKFSLTTITPAEATRILAEHDQAIADGEIINRPRRTASVTKYQADLIAGRWYAETGETLKFQTFDENLHGKHLLDGQNRLDACARSKRDLTVYVARGVGRAAFSFIDGGAQRNLASKLLIKGEDSTPQLAAALKWLVRWKEDEKRLCGVSVTDQACMSLLESDPAIKKSVAAAKAVSDQKLIGVGVASFIHRVVSKENAVVADQFIDALSTGAGLLVGDPFLSLRQRLTAIKGSRSKVPAFDVVAMCIRSCNAKLQGREVKKLRGAKNLSEMPSLDAGKSNGGAVIESTQEYQHHLTIQHQDRPQIGV